MTALRKEDLFVTPEAYLAAERISETRHEYLGGVVYAMAGGRRTHNQIAANLVRELGNQLEGKRCTALWSDMRLRIHRAGATYFYYPDVVVDCSGSNLDEVEEPTVIFEVLSPETERFDRGEKLINYQSIPSTRVVVLVDQFREVVTIYRKDEGADWSSDLLISLDDVVQLPEIGCALPLRRIYDGVVPIMPA